MKIEEKVIEDIKTAMKAKDSLTLETLRGVKSQFKYYQIEKKLDALTEEDVLTVISRLVKQRQDAIEEFNKANRLDLSEKEQKELDILKQYLPEALSDDALREVIQKTIEEVGATEKKQMGLVMKALMPKVKGRADGKKVNLIVNEILA